MSELCCARLLKVSFGEVFVSAWNHRASN